MVLESELDAQLATELDDHRQAKQALGILIQDREVTSLLEQANTVSITRMGFNDHGRVHAKIVSLNSSRIYRILRHGEVQPNIVKEEVGTDEDALTAIVVGSYLHDIGMSVSRDSHDLLGVYLANDILRGILPKIIAEEDRAAQVRSVVLEEILCHLGEYRATSLEAKVVATSDGTDMTKGRARIPYKIAHPDIHQFSALAIEKVGIAKGMKKPIGITVEMSDTAGVFQIEHQLLQKIRDVGFQDYVEVHAKIKDGRRVDYLV